MVHVQLWSVFSSEGQRGKMFQWYLHVHLWGMCSEGRRKEFQLNSLVCSFRGCVGKGGGVERRDLVLVAQLWESNKCAVGGRVINVQFWGG